MGFMSRQPTPNDPQGGMWVYGPREPHDDFSALVNGIAHRCSGCRRVTLARFLSPLGKCPECYEVEPS